ncbi:MoaD/ThiS family protein [Luteolibacter marinus]|uniref:MoaD/ThiS family protein n=1 Tax=Luteolibacter marinus TaxID=2776705 RepID=UPI001865BE4A|nr:MoaD/ThiS family protein [Luteolibacter marinus]
MPSIAFSQHLQTHVDVVRSEVTGSTVREALEEVVKLNPRLKSYVLEDTGAVRKHISIFVNGESVRDRLNLSDPLPADGDVFVMQALSGG